MGAYLKNLLYPDLRRPTIDLNHNRRCLRDCTVARSMNIESVSLTRVTNPAEELEDRHVSPSTRREIQ